MRSSKQASLSNRSGGGVAGSSRSKNTGSVSDSCDWPIRFEEAGLHQKAAELIGADSCTCSGVVCVL